jgi:hypothetical protein
MWNENDATRQEAQGVDAPSGEFLMNNGRVIACLVISSVIIMVGLSLVVLGFVFAFDEPVINQRVGTVLLGTCMLVLSLILFVSNWKKYGQRVQVSAEGLRFQKRGQWSDVLWEDIAAVWRSSSTIQGSLALLETDVWIQGKDGKTLYLTSFFRDMARLVEIVLTETARRMFPAMSSQLRQGQTVVFGKVQISATELVASGKSLAWDEVHAIKVAMGAIDIRRKGDKNSWYYIYIKKMPNYHLFLALADILLKARGTERQEEGAF